MGDCECECEKGIPVLACVDIVVILCERLKNFGRVFGGGYAEIRVSLPGRRDAWRGFNAREHGQKLSTPVTIRAIRVVAVGSWLH